MRRAALALAGMAGLAGALPGAAGAAEPSDPLAELRRDCRVQRSADRPPRRAVDYRICTASLPSFDGTRLDATLTLPARVEPGRQLPLIVFLHGLLNTKREQMSLTRTGAGPDRGGEAYKTVRWNNVWFASRGYAVLNYTARGHEGSEGQVELASPAHEVRDTRFLVGRLADDPALGIDPRRVAILGGSYGGGQAWLLLTTREDPALQFGEWRSPGGRLVRLAAVVAQYTWTDLLYTVAPNGRHLSTGVDSATGDRPLGVGKQTMVDGFIATFGPRLTPQIARWLARFNAGEPYDDPPDATVEEARQGLRARSAFYQDAFFAALRAGRQRRVPVLAAQGWTDPIFAPIEAVRMYRRLRAADARYPIGLYFGDFEHLSALVRIPDLLYVHRLGNRLLDRALRRRGFGIPYDARSAVNDCDPRRMGRILRARDWDALAPAQLAFDLAGPRQTASPLADPRGPDSDPVLVSSARGRGCLHAGGSPAPGVAAWEMPIARDFTLLGMPRLRLAYRVSAPDVQLNSRLWDVAPDGTQTLVTRGAYRALRPDPAGAVADYELFGHAWRLRAGHRLLLEVLQVDAPYLRPNNFASSAAIDSARLVLPGRFG